MFYWKRALSKFCSDIIKKLLYKGEYVLQRTLHIRKCQFLTSFYSFVKQAKSVVDVSVNLDINWLGQIAYGIYFGFSDEQEVHSKSSYKTLRKKCPYSEFFWSAFSRIWTEYEKVFRISPDSVQLREKVDQKNSEYEHISCNERKAESSVH